MLRTIFATKISKNGFVTHRYARFFAEFACYAQDFFPNRAGAPQQRWCHLNLCERFELEAHVGWIMHSIVWHIRKQPKLIKPKNKSYGKQEDGLISFLRWHRRNMNGSCYARFSPQKFLKTVLLRTAAHDFFPNLRVTHKIFFSYG